MQDQAWWVAWAFILVTVLGQCAAERRATRAEVQGLQDGIEARMAQLVPLTHQYQRLRDSVDVHHDWASRVAAIGMRSQILLLRDDRDRMERRLAELEDRDVRRFNDPTLPPRIGSGIRIMVNGRSADSTRGGGGDTIQFQAHLDSGDVE
jgi:hypothetical protein